MAKKFYQLGANDDVALEEDVSAKYTKPATGIPKDDLSEDVKTSIGSANSAMQHSEFSALSGIADLVPDEVGLPQICSLMNTIKNLLKPTTACIAFLASLLTINAADFQTAKYSALVGKDEVVTNLSFAGLATESYVVTKISEATGDYQNVSNKAYSALQPTDVVNNVTSDATDKPLSANMGKELQDQISNLKQRGRYLSVWNCTNGLPTTSPTVSPYVYKAGDYYIVGFVSTATNYRPSGVSYTQDVPSTTVETQTVLVNDTYYFDGTVWTLLQAAQKEISFGSITGSPYDNTNLKDELDSGFAYTTAVSNKLENGKQDTISDLATIRAGAAKGDTAVQPAAISDMATKTWVGQQGYETTVHASQTYQTKISDYTTTNAVISISSTQITNSVLSGYLCTKAAAVAMTNAAKAYADGKFFPKSSEDGTASIEWGFDPVQSPRVDFGEASVWANYLYTDGRAEIGGSIYTDGEVLDRSGEAKYLAIDGQVQANWTETDTESKAYIQNKPTIISGSTVTNIAEAVVVNATNDATLVRYDANGEAGAKLKHGTTAVTAADVGALPATYEDEKYSVDASIVFSYGLSSYGDICVGDVFETSGSGFSKLGKCGDGKWFYGSTDDESNEIATLGDITAEKANAFPALYDEETSRYTTLENLEFHGGTIFVDSITGYSSEPYIGGSFHVDPSSRPEGDNGVLAILSDIPTSLKNPNALTFTGAASGSYDGSSALTVTIPEGMSATTATNIATAVAIEMIDASNNTFSNAVMMVATNMATNDWEAIRELAELPVGTAAGGIGMVLAAIGAAIATLKRKTKIYISKDDTGYYVSDPDNA